MHPNDTWQLRLPHDLRDKIAPLAEEDGLSIPNMVRHLIALGLKTHRANSVPQAARSK